MADESNFLTYALIAGAGYLLYQYFAGAPATCTPDAAGVCTRYTDQQLLNQINAIEWTGTGDIPAEQIARIDPQILATYTQYTGVTPGSVLAYMLGLGITPPASGSVNGSDGYTYTVVNGVFVRGQKTGLTGLSQGNRTELAFRRGAAMYGWS